MIIWLSLLIIGRNGHLEKQMEQAPDHRWLEAQQGLELSSASQQLKEGDGHPACAPPEPLSNEPEELHSRGSCSSSKDYFVSFVEV